MNLMLRVFISIYFFFSWKSKVQGYRFDPDGDYVRTWLPELARMPTEWIHHPWNAPKCVLEAAGVELGVNYPKPLVDINTAQERLDDAATMMWELNRAARAEKLDGSAEVVEDNLLSMEVLDIPKVVVKKEVSADTSSFHQRVLPFQNLKSYLRGKGMEEPNGKTIKGVETKDPRNNSKVDEEDLLSTVESSTRKRSYNESQCAVPPSCFSSISYKKMQSELDSFKARDSVRSPSVQLWQEPDGNGVKKVIKFMIVFPKLIIFPLFIVSL